MTAGSRSSELKLTATAGALGVIPLLMDVVRGDGSLSDNMMLALIGGLTLVAVAYNISRGMSKYEPRLSAGVPPTGLASSEFRVSATLGGLGVAPFFVELLSGKATTLSETVQIALVVSVSLIAASYAVSRGMAKSEPVGTTPTPSAG